jgi:protein SCO1/2
MRGIRLTACVAILASALIFTGCGSDETTGQLNGMTRQPPTKVGDVTLPDVNPNSSDPSRSLKGEGDGLMLVYFGFTSCPDICPTTLADVRLALEGLDEAERDRVRVGMVTVDPKRDTAKVLNGYLGHFFPQSRFSALRTTDAGQLARAEEEFGASHRIGKTKKDGSYDVSHSAQTYAVNSEGVVEVEWPFGTAAEDMQSDLELLLDQRTQVTDQ